MITYFYIWYGYAYRNVYELNSIYKYNLQLLQNSTLEWVFLKCNDALYLNVVFFLLWLLPYALYALKGPAFVQLHLIL